ncbi:MAG: hypothetical protein LBR34_04340 [Prevotella sp.]|jgi:hypothetical protein|nr:hypothetical protein [Prevotella sp.]
MKEKKNLYHLAEAVSAQTRIEQKVVVAFLNQFFKEIERGVIVSSAVKIDNLGIFRAIKSLSAERLLFLGKFVGDAKSGTPAVPQAQPDDAFSDDVTHAETEDAEQPEIAEQPENIITASDFSEDEKQTGKKRLSRRLKIFALFLVTLIAVVGLLYALYLYPKKNGASETTAQQFSPFSPMFEEVNNDDTINFTHVIRITGPNVDFNGLSKVYYFHEQFWPYIYKANESVVSGPFEIPEGIIIKIPKLDAELIDYQNQSSVDKAKVLVNEIINRGVHGVAN